MIGTRSQHGGKVGEPRGRAQRINAHHNLGLARIGVCGDQSHRAFQRGGLVVGVNGVFKVDTHDICARGHGLGEHLGLEAGEKDETAPGPCRIAACRHDRGS